MSALQKPIVIIIPVLNDWESLWILIAKLEEVIKKETVVSLYHVLIVDDGSDEPVGTLPQITLPHLSFSILHLKKNMGHQKAIAIGLCHICNTMEPSSVVIMDGDGEDKPEDALRLLQLLGQSQSRIIFAERNKRSEGFFFTFFYRLYQSLHFILTGLKVNIGNFCAFRSELLPGICVDGNIWVHFAASIRIAKIKYTTLSTERGKRYRGKSKMNFSRLVIHGLSALALYSEIISVRLLIFCTCLSLGLGIGAVCGYLQKDKFFQNSSSEINFLWIATIQGLIFTIFFIFHTLSNRGQSVLLPIRDYRWFVKDESIR